MSNNENEKCENSERIIKAALDAHPSLNGLIYTVFAQGSYKANTNVRADSDVDVCICCTNTYFDSDLPAGIPPSVRGPFIPSVLQFPEYKQRVHQALYDRFGTSGLIRGDKAFQLRENTYRIQADVVPTFEYRLYYLNGGVLATKLGTCFFTDSGKFIVNFPYDTLQNGREKNVRTGYRYKRVVRVLKGLRNELEANGSSNAKKISSFQIACLVYNVSDYYFTDDLYQTVYDVSRHIWHCAYQKSCSTWLEVDETKPLFADNANEKIGEVEAFFWELINYVGFKE